MEVNKEESERCIGLSKDHLRNGNLNDALRLALKAEKLYPSASATAWVEIVKKKKESGASGGGSSTSNGSGQRKNSTSASSSGHQSASSASSSSQPEREYTKEQAEAVAAIKKCGKDLYAILGLQKSATEADIKKAYRKLALQFHPDKNGAPGADEAFKAINHAFSVLSTPEKRSQYDRFGIDGQNQRGGGGGSSGFSSSSSGEGPRFDADYELSPEEIFNLFFGQDAFGPGIRTANGFRFTNMHAHPRQFNRQRPQQPAPMSSWDRMIQLLQLLPLLLFILYSLFGGNFGSSTPAYSFEQVSPYTIPRKTTMREVPFFVNDHIDRTLSKKIRTRQDQSWFESFEREVELAFHRRLKDRCEVALYNRRNRLSNLRFYGTTEQVRSLEKEPVKECDELRKFEQS